MSAPHERVDVLLLGAAQLATPRGRTACAGAAMDALLVIDAPGIALSGATIAAVDTAERLRRTYPDARVELLEGGLLVPGFVDAHTHPVFAGTRELEFELRTRGASYVEIAQAGGGILSSVQGLRSASDEALLRSLLARLDRFLDLGTTTVEAKSGYGLSLRDELRSLELIAQARRLHALELVPTVLGAHEFPPEFRGDHEGYLQLLCAELLPEVARRGLAEYCDAFADAHVFDLAQTRRVLQRARELGLGLRLHADQLSPMGGAELAAELGAASADHLENISAAGIEALGRAGVVPVLCPLVPLYLRQQQEAPGRRMLDAGLAVALSTDFNPGSCYTQSLHEALTFGALRYRMSAAECLTACTLNAAASLGRAQRIGSLEPGKQADIALLDLAHFAQLAYDFGRARVRGVWKAGKRVRGH